MPEDGPHVPGANYGINNSCLKPPLTWVLPRWAISCVGSPQVRARSIKYMEMIAVVT